MEKIYLTPETPTGAERIFTKYKPTCIGGWFSFMGPSIASLPTCNVFKNKETPELILEQDRETTIQKIRGDAIERSHCKQNPGSYLRSIHAFLKQARLCVYRTAPLWTVAFLEVSRSISRGRRGWEMGTGVRAGANMADDFACRRCSWPWRGAFAYVSFAAIKDTRLRDVDARSTAHL